MPLADAFVRSGKVRDLYRVGDDRLLLVACDRLSAFDVVLPTPIPDKGRILTGLSRFWFAQTTDIVANHLLSTDPADLPDEITRGDPALIADLRGRMMLGRRADVLPVECVVRGYLSAGPAGRSTRPPARSAGSGFPAGLRESDRLPSPIFTPAWKAPAGQHDENILVPPGAGADRRASWRTRSATISLALYARGAALCERVGIILADTKFEFGVPAVGRAAAHRRGHDAGLLALLGRRGLRAGPRPGELRQAVRPRLAAERSRGTRPRRGRSSRTTWWPAPAPATSRPSNASPGRASPATSRRTSSPDERARPAPTASPSTSRPSPASWTPRARPWSAASRTSASPASPASASAAASS